MNYDVVIVASGKGERANLGYNKAFFIMKNQKTVIENSSKLFIEDDDCKNIIIVTSNDYIDKVFKHEKVKVILGGKERKDSVENGLNMVESEYVLIHDAVRPFLNIKSLEKLKEALSKKDACILAHKAIDTVKLVKNNIIEKTIDRETIYLAETPQGFKTSLIKDAYKKSKDMFFTDDASLLENLGYDVYVVVNEYNNMKLTQKEDFIDL